MVQAPPAPRTSLNVVDPQGNPLYKLSLSQPLIAASAEFAAAAAVRQEAANLLAARASNVLQRPIEEIVIRDILPSTDFGLTNEEWITGALVANAYTAYINQQLNQSQLAAVYSMIDQSAAPTVLGARFQSGTAQIWALVETERGYGFADSVEVLIRPTLIWDPNETVHIDLYANGTATQRVIFGGFMAEAIGVTVAPPDYT